MSPSLPLQSLLTSHARAKAFLDAVSQRSLLDLETCLKSATPEEIVTTLATTEESSLWSTLFASSMPEAFSSGFEALGFALEGVPWPEGGRLLWKKIAQSLEEDLGKESFRYLNASRQLKALLDWGLFEEIPHLVTRASSLPEIPYRSRLDVLTCFLEKGQASSLLQMPSLLSSSVPPLSLQPGVDQECLKKAQLLLCAPASEWPLVKSMLVHPHASLLLFVASEALDTEARLRFDVSEEEVLRRTEDLLPGCTQHWLMDARKRLEFGSASATPLLNVKTHDGSIVSRLPLHHLQQVAEHMGASAIETLTVLACLYRPPEEAELWLAWATSTHGPSVLLNPLHQSPPLSVFDILAARTMVSTLDAPPHFESISDDLSRVSAWWQACHMHLAPALKDKVALRVDAVLDGILTVQARLFDAYKALPQEETKHSRKRKEKLLPELKHAASAFLETSLSFNRDWWFTASTTSFKSVRHLEHWWRDRLPPKIYKEPDLWTWSSHLKVEGAPTPVRAAYWRPFFTDPISHPLFQKQYLDTVLSHPHTSTPSTVSSDPLPATPLLRRRM